MDWFFKILNRKDVFFNSGIKKDICYTYSDDYLEDETKVTTFKPDENGLCDLGLVITGKHGLWIIRSQYEWNRTYKSCLNFSQSIALWPKS